MSYDLILRATSALGPLEYERLKSAVAEKLTGIEVRFMDEADVNKRQELLVKLAEDEPERLINPVTAAESLLDIATIHLKDQDANDVAKIWPSIVNVARREDLIIFDASSGRAVNLVDPGVTPPGFTQYEATKRRSLGGAIFYVVCSLATIAYALMHSGKHHPIAIFIWSGLSLLYLFWAFKEVRKR